MERTKETDIERGFPKIEINPRTSDSDHDAYNFNACFLWEYVHISE